MDADLARELIETTVASSAAILLVALLRRPLRAAMGARAAYWLWMLVPAFVIAAWIPAPSPVLERSTDSLPGRAHAAVAIVSAAVTPVDSKSIYTTAGLVLWAAGAGSMLTLLVRRQRRFVRSLGEMQPDSDGVRRSRGCEAPLLVGALKPRIVVPADFESRYSVEERALVLAHERAHLSRHDATVNGLASAWLCVCWFNPLVYWAIGRLRVDQELACDALVLARTSGAVRCYGEALLKTQLATEAGWRLPVGCHWQSIHPLKERIAMLKRPQAGILRRLFGIAGVVGLTVSTSYAVWAAQSPGGNGPDILVTLKLTVEDSTGAAVANHAVSTQYLARSGEIPEDLIEYRPYTMVCKPYLPGSRKEIGDGIAMRPGQIFSECEVRANGDIVFTPAALAYEGTEVELNYADHDGKRRFTLVVLASTSAKDIEAAGVRQTAAAEHESSKK